MYISLAVEGDADAAVAERVVTAAGHQPGPVHGLQGSSWIDRNLGGLNRAAVGGPWFVLRDLDRESCAVSAARQLLPEPSHRMCFRLAVRAIESWLLADREQIARFLSVSESLVPSDPDEQLQPKEVLVNLARRSRVRAIRDDMVPAPGHSRSVGPAYNARVLEFVGTKWRPEVAARRSDSLARCLRALRRLR